MWVCEAKRSGYADMTNIFLYFPNNTNNIERMTIGHSEVSVDR